MAEYKLFLHRVGLVAIVQLFTSLSGIILLPILAKNLLIEEYGIWAQVMVTIGIFPGIVMFGLPYTMVRFLSGLKTQEDIQETFYSIFFLVVFTSGIASLLFFIFSETIASILFDKNVFVVKILSLIVFIECLNSLFTNYLRARQRIKSYSLCIFFKTTIQISIVSFFVIMGYGISGAITGVLITQIVLFCYIFRQIILDIGIRPPKFKNMKEYLKFGVPTVPGNFSSWIVNSSDRYVIGILLGTASVGYYSPGYTLGNIISMFFAPLSFLLPVTLSKSYDENDLEEVIKILSYSFKYLMTIAIPATFGISILSKPILTILSTPEIASQGYLITPFVALGALLLGVYGIIVQVLVLEKRTLITGKIWIIAAILNLLLNFVFIPYFGIVGAAITTLIAFTISLILTMHYSFKFLKFDVNLEFILKSVVSSILMSYIIYLLNPEGLISILLTIGVCASVYFIVLYSLKGFDKNEFELLYNIIKH
ncbi:flippase [Methanosarcina sp. WWM596]|uniref:flippase n=1 Tax=Methanosarcina sp. WWM596 TaxID=1434103 RepID=UPI0006158CC6|nr:flippase [Methanosarcina sp. WWM596]AKB18823.1 Membrane protein involved in the export of O-antigen, teichoic acid lipoteichoic acids [Methanosarcina sp. WWM596]